MCVYACGLYILNRFSWGAAGQESILDFEVGDGDDGVYCTVGHKEEPSHRDGEAEEEGRSRGGKEIRGWKNTVVHRTVGEE
jgi:hypothetical protein